MRTLGMNRLPISSPNRSAIGTAYGLLIAPALEWSGVFYKERHTEDSSYVVLRDTST
jgi:hypothetical protein